MKKTKLYIISVLAVLLLSTILYPKHQAHAVTEEVGIMPLLFTVQHYKIIQVLKIQLQTY